MKKQILFMAIIAAMTIGCKTEEPEEQPTAKFTYLVRDKEVTFENQSVNARDFYWEFGDGTTSIVMNPIKTYEKEGTYVVSLRAQNITKTDTYSESITISYKKPTAKFTYSADELKVTFTNQSTDAQSYVWNFGNGQTSEEKDPTITYGKEGTFTVSLIARNGDQTDTCQQSIAVSYKKPNASYSYKKEHPLKVVFTNKSTNATSYKWDFGDGKTSTEKNPTHKYSGHGVYKVRLTAYNNSKSSYVEQNITVEDPTTCYVSGFTIKKIPNNNYYYQVQLTDDYTFSKTTYFYTYWYLLSSANVPYSHTLTTATEINTNKTYVLRFYKSANKTSGQASGKGFWSAKVTSSDLKTFPETMTLSDSSVSIQLSFTWK